MPKLDMFITTIRKNLIKNYMLNNSQAKNSVMHNMGTFDRLNSDAYKLFKSIASHPMIVYEYHFNDITLAMCIVMGTTYFVDNFHNPYGMLPDVCLNFVSDKITLIQATPNFFTYTKDFPMEYPFYNDINKCNLYSQLNQFNLSFKSANCINLKTGTVFKIPLDSYIMEDINRAVNNKNNILDWGHIGCIVNYCNDPLINNS